MIKVMCPACEKKYSIIDDMSGKEIRCNACTHLFIAPKVKTRNVWISTICTSCNKLYKVSEKMLGKKYQCRRCNCSFIVSNFDKKEQVKASCPTCKKRYRITNKNLIGKEITCKECKTKFIVIPNKEEKKETIQYDKQSISAKYGISKFDVAGQTLPVLPNVITKKKGTEEKAKIKSPIITPSKIKLKRTTKTEKMENHLTKKQLDFATAETIYSQEETLQNEIARQIKDMESTQSENIPSDFEHVETKNEINPSYRETSDDLDSPIKTEVLEKNFMTKEELEFATAQTINPKNETLQNQIAQEIQKMEADSEDTFDDFAVDHLVDNVKELTSHNKIDDKIQEKNDRDEFDESSESDEFDESDEEIDNIDLRNTAEEIIIDNLLDDDDEGNDINSNNVEFSNDSDDYDTNMVEEITDIGDDFDDDDDDDDDFNDVDLRNTAEEIIIDDILDDDEIERINNTNDSEQVNHEHNAEEIDDITKDISYTTAIEVNSNANIESENSGFLKLESEEVLIPSEILVPEDIFSSDKVSTKKNPFADILDEDLENTVSMPVIDAETESEEKEDDWNIGDVIIGLYSVTEEIGAGEHGKIYKVYHKKLAMHMAVKNIVIKSSAKENFEEELNYWGKLSIHPNIINYYYTRNLKGRYRIFMEYNEGNDLSFLLKSEHVGNDSLYKSSEYESMKRVFAVAIQLAWSLSYAHSQNVVHGNINPNNIIITTNFDVKLTDFALHKICQTKLNNSLYTFTSVNQKSISKNVDILGWGLVVLHMFSGDVYWRNESNPSKILNDYPEQIRKDNVPKMPDEIFNLLDKCFSGNPPTFDEIAKKLQDIYLNVVEMNYPKQEPDINSNLADGLNNQAVLLMDLENFSVAEKLFNKALDTDNYHLHATYNLGLLTWRKALITDLELLHKLQAILSLGTNKWQTYHFLSWVNIERGDKDSAYKTLNAAELEAKGNMVVQNLLSQTMDNVIENYEEKWVLTGHEDSVGSVCVSSDNNIAVSSSSDHTIRVWDLRTGDSIQTLSGHAGYVNGISLTIDGKTLVSASWDNSIRVWDLENGQCKNVIMGHDHHVNDVVVSEDGKIAISASWDHTLRVWELETGLCKKILKGHTDNVNSVHFSSEVDLVISGSSDMTIRVWDVNSGECLRVLEGHDDEIQDVAITSDGDMAVSVSWDKTIRIWDIWTGNCLRILKGHTDKISSVFLTKDASTILTSSWDGTIRIWDATNGRCMRTIDKHKDKVYDVTMANNAPLMISASADQTVNVWEMKKQMRQAPLMIVRPKESMDNRANQNLVAILLAEAKKALQNKKWEAAANLLNTARQKKGYERYPECLDLWEKLSQYSLRGSLKGAWQRHVLEDHKHCIEAIAVNSTATICAASSYNKIYMWDLQRGERLQTLEGHSSKVKDLVFVEKENLIVSCGDDQTVRVWDTKKNTCKHVLRKHKYSIRSIAVMPNGHIGISASYKTLSVWNIREGKYLFDLIGHEHWIESVAISNDGRIAVSCGYDKTIRIWDIATAKCMNILTGHEANIRSVAITIDGRMLVSGSYDNTIKIWDVSTGKCLNTLIGHKDRIEEVSMSLDGLIVISASWDKTLRMWDVVSGKCLCTLEGHINKLRSARISPNAQIVIAGGWGKNVHVWNIDWDLIAKSKVKWDDNARMWLQSFLSLHTPIESDDPNNPLFLIQKGAPVWTDSDIDDLTLQLKSVGLGWLQKEKIKENLEKMKKMKKNI